MRKIFSMNWEGKDLTIETGQMAQLSNGSAVIRYGDTVILSTVTSSDTPRDGINFFPLNVSYEEKSYAVGKIPGGISKREGKPSDEAILTSRLIDRPIRPLFPKDFRNDVNISNMVLSADYNNSPEIASIIGSSIALSISDVPFDGPIGAVSLGLINGEFIVNPNKDQKEKSEMYLVLAGTKDKVMTIEAKANEVPEDVMLKAISKGQEEIKKIVEFIEKIQKEVGKYKFEYPKVTVPKDIYKSIKKFAYEDMKSIVISKDKQIRSKNINLLKSKCTEHFNNIEKNVVFEALEKLEKKAIREYILKENLRIDGRKLNEVRPLSAEVSILPKTHGSALFQRGQTQVLSTVTLAGLDESYRSISIGSEGKKNYIHHYNFPGFATGDIKPSTGPGRREIGHGALTEKALDPVIPSRKDFPYAIRTVTEVLMSNGSSSQASICGTTLALMDAGVPIKSPVAGIAAGLVADKKNPDKFVTMLDLQGIEDFYGDMDFKVAGTKNGITAIQMDTKINGLNLSMIKEALDLTKKGRLEILDNVILKTLSEPRKELSSDVPNAKTTKLEPRQIFKGTVTKIAKFGAFVTTPLGKDGLIHISKLDNKKVDKVEDVVKVGDEIEVMFLGYDDKGRIKLSLKDVLNKTKDSDLKHAPKISNEKNNGEKGNWSNILDKLNNKTSKPSDNLLIQI